MMGKKTVDLLKLFAPNAKNTLLMLVLAFSAPLLAEVSTRECAPLPEEGTTACAHSMRLEATNPLISILSNTVNGRVPTAELTGVVLYGAREELPYPATFEEQSVTIPSAEPFLLYGGLYLFACSLLFYLSKPVPQK